MDETMILKGLSFLCIFGHPFALGKSPYRPLTNDQFTLNNERISRKQ